MQETSNTQSQLNETSGAQGFTKRLMMLKLHKEETSICTTRKNQFSEGMNPSLNYYNSVINEFSEGFCDDM